MVGEPLFEEGGDGAGEADGDEAGGGGAVVSCGAEDAGDFVVGEAGDAGGEHDADGDFCIGQGADGVEAALGAGGAGFHFGG